MAFNPTEFVSGIGDGISNFISQSQRVLNVTHKPGPEEYRRIATITAIGMVIIGATGFIISMVAILLKG